MPTQSPAAPLLLHAFLVAGIDPKRVPMEGLVEYPDRVEYDYITAPDPFGDRPLSKERRTLMLATLDSPELSQHYADGFRAAIDLAIGDEGERLRLLPQVPGTSVMARRALAVVQDTLRLVRPR